MKKFLIACMLSVMATGLIAGTNTKMEEKKMEQVIRDYALGADTANIKLIENSFHENFQVVANTQDGVRAMDKKTYMSLLTAGKIGGTKRILNILKTENDGTIGTAKLTLTGDKVIFNDYLTLIKVGKNWSIVSNVTSIMPR
jgi:hypothetical protein